ncbi:DUF6049 family protein [Planomonospora parontospora]|uniref:DUF6049 family protein n=1 Tax=Planomonospora parontospora TaxID=58119 RepID=UPI00167112F9|nr:DUF6049 family protein [Planomonospora parontospora]GGL40003.1 hypothetical protein GCM10014719_46370 [Planomonospora parontospora subsp. antibiotica]GII16281.1 hypothetical protein Ppa05_30070 [Planomonospora parontospora subsp. antibiotica]
MIRKHVPLVVLLATLLSLAAVATGGTATAGTTTAARQTLQLVIASITPDLPKEPATEIRVSGTLANTGTEARTGLRYRLRYSAQPFARRADMAAYLSGQEHVQPGGLRDESWLQQPLAASAKLPWEFVFTPQQLGLYRFGVYPLAVEVVDAAEQKLAVQRTFLTYLPKGTETPRTPRTRLAVVLPVIDQPHRADDGTFLDQDLTAALAEGKRLDDLLKTAQGVSSAKGVTWVVDPALLDDVRTLGRAHRVKAGAETVSRPADAAATRWLGALRTALAGSPVVATPYADPDVAALAHNGLDGTTRKGVAAAVRTGRELLGRDVVTDVNWPAGGVIDHDGLDVLSVAGVRSVLLSEAGLPPAAPAVTVPGAVAQPPATTPNAVATLQSVSGPVRALVADPVLSDIVGATASSPDWALLNRRRFIAETAMISAEPVTGRRTVVAAPPRRWSPDPAYVAGLVETAGSLPWLSPATLDAVKPGKVVTPRAGLTYTPQDRGRELGKKYLTGVRRVGERAGLVTSVTPDGPEADDSGMFDLALLRLASSAWRDRTRAAEPYVEQLRSTVDGRIDQVRIVGGEQAEQIRTLAGEDGEVPISVRNERKGDGSTVAVRVKVTSQKPGRLRIEPYEDRMVISGGQTQTVRIPMTITGASGGQTSVTVQLTTDDGRAYGQRVKLTVRSTGYTGIALVIAGAALLVMLAAVGLRVLRRRGARRAATAATPSRRASVPAGTES